MNTKRNFEEGTPKHLRVMGWTAAVLAALVAVVWWPGCRQYPPVTTRENLDLIKQFYTACNTRDPARLARAEKKLDQLVKGGEVSSSEEAGFRRIADLAKGGDWSSAESAALRFAKDQVGQGP